MHARARRSVAVHPAAHPRARGRAGLAPRLALFAAGVDFRDERLAPKQWPLRKPHTPLGQLPVLTRPDGSTVTQSNAIAKWAARQCTQPEGLALYPSAPVDAQLAVDEVI